MLLWTKHLKYFNWEKPCKTALSKHWLSLILKEFCAIILKCQRWYIAIKYIGTQTSERRNKLFRNIPISSFVALPMFPGSASVPDETALSDFWHLVGSTLGISAQRGWLQPGRHSSCHPIYLMFGFASAVTLQASYTCSTFSIISACVITAWFGN